MRALARFELIEPRDAFGDDGTERLQQAVRAFEQALLVWTRERAPLDSATTQNNLGVAFQTLGERESVTERLRQAVRAFQQTLLEKTRERLPLEWARTQNNLGTVLRVLVSARGWPSACSKQYMPASRRFGCGHANSARGATTFGFG